MNPEDLKYRRKEYNQMFKVLCKIWDISENEMYEDLVQRAARQIIFIESRIHLEKIDINLLADLRRFYFSVLAEVIKTSEYKDNEWLVPTVPGMYLRFTLKEAQDRAIQIATLEDILKDRKAAKEL